MSSRVENSARLYAKWENRAYKEAEHLSSSFLAQLLCVRRFCYNWGTHFQVEYIYCKDKISSL